MIGQIISHYRVLQQLGGGGMGVVYEAEDLTLGRRVALKFLPPATSTDAAALERFQREARAASALNHPNICTIHEIGQQEGQYFIVMELLEGKTLRDAIAHRALPIDHLVELASEIADGLEAAHGRGIIHRDIKPANIFVTQRGHAKILDFGLAKLEQKMPAGSPASVGAAPTVMSEAHLTSPGTAVGTIAYMSPEQASGEELDARTDLFSFGAVLYEMATGLPAFSGNTSAMVFDAILHKAPVSPVRLNPALPAELERITNKLLEKDRKLRYQHAGDVVVDLKRLRRDVASGRTGVAAESAAGSNYVRAGTPKVSPRAKAKWAAIGIAMLVAILCLAYLRRPIMPVPRVTGYTKITHDGWQKNVLGQVAPTILTDGPRLYVQENIRGRFMVAQVAASGGETVPISTPFANTSLDNLSADKSQLIVGSFTGLEIDQPLWLLPTLGGSPRRLSAIPGQDAIWLPNGDLLVASQNTLTLQERNSAATHTLITVGDLQYSAYWLRISPDERVLRFTVSSASSYRLAEVGVDGSSYHQLLTKFHPDDYLLHGNWMPDGKFFVFEDFHNNRSDIWALQEKDNLFHKLDREPIRLTAGPLSFHSPQPSTDGKRIFVIGEQQSAELVRYDGKLQQFVPYLDGISAFGVSFSPDGRWVSYVSYPEGDLWRSRVDGTEKLQLTSAPLFALSPQWSPDGKQIAFVGSVPGKMQQIYLVPAEGGTLQELPVATFNAGWISWDPDGNTIFFADASGPNNTYLRSVNVHTQTVLTLPNLPDARTVHIPVRSPRGRWLLASTLDGQQLMLLNLDTQKWSELVHMSVGSAGWSVDGQHVYFDAGSGTDAGIYRVRIADRKLERIADTKGIRRPFTGWLPWIGITPDGSPLIMRDVGTQEVYALELEER